MQTDMLLADESAATRADLGTEVADELRRWWRASRRLDVDVQRDVTRALCLDGLVPMTVDAQVRDGIVTLSGTVDAEWERDYAKYLASCVPGVLGIVDGSHRLPRPDDDRTLREAVAVALVSTAIADLTDLTVEVPCPGTVVLSGAVHTRSEHDLVIAAAWSVADVEAVDDCIYVEG